ncbi:ABC-2 type transport system ATP-binding protein [Bifidobacterium bohemicum]|nr:ABC transporter ATP-binding protein [Bifidobacterium bohemicum]SCC20056.1 ABC-2 type transport system ATP-binding protein [Bifidobacterium bohemicum]
MVAMSSNALELTHVSRDFNHGKFHAVNDLSFMIKPGEIFALVGVNGAGKTTTVKMCSTLLTPTSGSILVNGYDTVTSSQNARNAVGMVLGGDRGFYPKATVLSNMRFFASLAGVPYRQQSEQIDDLLDQVNLSEKRTACVNTLSRGQKQRLHIARALLGNPKLLLLDEPTVGLDPDIALQIRDVITMMANQGIGILLTSHSMPEVEELADTVAIINNGKMCVQGNLADIYQYAHVSKTSMFSLAPSEAVTPDDIKQWFSNNAIVLCRSVSAKWNFTILWNNASESPQQDIVHQFSVRELAVPPDIVTRPSTLEDAFLVIAQENRHDEII